MREFPSMGIYVINRNVMVKLLAEYFPTANDMKTQVIPGAISLGMKVRYYLMFYHHIQKMKNIDSFVLYF